MAKFKLGGVVKEFNDHTSGEIVVDFNACETMSFPVGLIYGALYIQSKSWKIVTIENRLPFNVKTVVHGDAIAIKPYEYNINVEQQGETILNLNIEAGVSLELGPVVTLPPGEPASAENIGTGSHQVWKLYIPQGEKGET